MNKLIFTKGIINIVKLKRFKFYPTMIQVLYHFVLILKFDTLLLLGPNLDQNGRYDQTH